MPVIGLSVDSGADYDITKGGLVMAVTNMSWPVPVQTTSGPKLVHFIDYMMATFWAIMVG
jgi:hypothetical protein